MITAIMQPYLFPYIGYFQLINAVDTFIIFDDVNYINKGWINRNRILLNNKIHKFTLSLNKASQNRIINEITIFDPHESKDRLMKLISQAYSDAPQYSTVLPLINCIMANNDEYLCDFIEYSIKQIAGYLEINTKFIRSSSIEIEPALKGQEKILAICRKTGSKVYINPIGGIDLYNRDIFIGNNIDLRFLKTGSVTYKQSGNEFMPALSIIDVLMYAGKNDIKQMLGQYELI